VSHHPRFSLTCVYFYTMSDPTPYRHQVGGWHKGIQSCVLKDKEGLILKPLKLNANPTYGQKDSNPMPRSSTSDSRKDSDEELNPVCKDELEFYQHLQTSSSQEDVMLKSLVPRFFGSREVVVEDGTAVPHLVLGDLAAGFQLPCVVDIKMGRTFYYPGKEQYKNKVKYATQRELGFCLTGLRVFHHKNGHLITELRPDACKRLTVTQVFEGLEMFCQSDSSSSIDLQKAVVTQLLCIHDWFLKQRTYKIRCGSILILYDANQLGNGQQTLQTATGDPLTAVVNGGLGVCGCTPKPQPMTGDPLPAANSDLEMCGHTLTVTVKMIDFAHVLYSDGERDENYIFGLENLIKFFNKRVNIKR
ncbi:hypothetical protein OTU49_008427, partial [Cherax quadricarinatus]